MAIHMSARHARTSQIHQDISGMSDRPISLISQLSFTDTHVSPSINMVPSPNTLSRSSQEAEAEEVDSISKLSNLYGATYLNTPGEEDDTCWYKYWKRVSSLRGRQYDLPSGLVASRFVEILASEINSLTAGDYPSERVLVFLSVTLQRNRLIKRAKDIRVMLERRLQLWTNGQVESLVNEAVSVDKKLAQSETGSDGVRKFHRLMVRGKVREAMSSLDEDGESSVLDPQSLTGENGRTVLDELKSKHPSPSIPAPHLLRIPDDLQGVPSLLPVQITADVVEKVAHKLHGGGGPSGVKADQWTDFLLRYGRSSHQLREAVAALGNKLANEDVPWERIRGLMASRLVALDKRPGVRPIGVGECLRRLLGKCMAEVTGDEVTNACLQNQLCGGLSGGIEGAVHVMNGLFEERATEGSKWGLLLVDAQNAFNSVNRIIALWYARMYWPSCARYLFNTYKGHAELVLQGSNGTGNMFSMEGVTQGDPLAMLLYGISTLHLIDVLREVGVYQCWYADDSSAQGTFDDLKKWWDVLESHGPEYGYYPQGSKSFLVVNPADKEEAEQTFRGSGISVVTGQRFLGGFVGQEEEKRAYVAKKLDGWVKKVKQLSAVGKHHPQDAHTAFTKSLQFRWQYVQKVLRRGGSEYQLLKEEIRRSLMPAVLGGDVSDDEADLFSLPVNKGGLAWTDPVRRAEHFFEMSKRGAAILQRAIVDRVPFQTVDHLTHLQAVKKEAKEERLKDEDALLQSTLPKFSTTRQRAIGRGILANMKVKSSVWLSAYPLKKHHFDLAPSEFRDALAVRYMRTPTEMPSTCDGCGHVPFSVRHALCCKTGGLVTRRHNEVRDVLGDLMLAAWGNCCKEPMILDPSPFQPGLRGDLACRGVWEPQRDALFDVRIVDTDASSYENRTVGAVLHAAEEEKKRKYLPACEQRHCSFTPLVSTVDGLFAPQMESFTKVLAEKLAEKWSRPIGDVRFWARARIAFAVVRAASLCIRGTRKKWRAAGELFGFGDGAGLQMGLN